MGFYRPNMETRAEQLKRNFSGWSDIKCVICDKALTHAQVAYCDRNASKFNSKRLCGFCQRLERYND